MTRDEFLDRTTAALKQARQSEQLLRTRLLDGDALLGPEEVAIHDALRHAIGLKRTLIRIVEVATPAGLPAGVTT